MPKFLKICLFRSGTIYKADRIVLENGFTAEEGVFFTTETDVEGSVECGADGKFERITHLNKNETIQKENNIELITLVNGNSLKNRLSLDKFDLKTYPNPFSSNLTVEYQLPEKGNANISLLNSAGQEIKKITNEKIKLKGKYIEKISTDELPSGIYFIRAILNSEVITKKITLMR